MLIKPMHKKLFAFSLLGKKEKEVLLQIGNCFYRLKPFWESDMDNFEEDLEILEEEYHLILPKEED